MLKQLSKKIESVNPKLVIGGLVGLGVIAGVTYYYTNKPRENPKADQKKMEIKQSLTSSRKAPIEVEESPEKCLIRVLNKIKKTFGEKADLNYQTVKAIYLGQYELSRKQFAQLALKYRVERRKVLNDINKYRQVTKGFEEQLDELHNRHLNSILAHFRIDKEGWMEVVEEVNVNNKDEWEGLLNEAENDEISSLRLKDKPKVNRQVLINIYKFMAKYLREKFEFYQALTDLDAADLHSLIQKQVQDKVFEHFKVEEEDIKFSEKQLSEEETEDLERYEEQYLDILRSLILKMQDEEGEEANQGDQA